MLKQVFAAMVMGEDGVLIAKKGEFSLLGLGDIVIPGLFIAILIRFDAVRAQVNPNGADFLSFPKPFFMTNIVAYALGLLATVLIMYYFNAAQPALLYLVPACLGGSLLCALVVGNFNEMLAYDEDVKTSTKVEEKQAEEKSK